MRDAYRDDLAAAQLRVADLEREHAALAAQNAALEAAAAPAPAPVPVRRSRTRLTGGELVVYVAVVGTSVGLFLLAGGPESWVKPIILVVALGTQALMKWCRRVTDASLPGPPEQRLAAPPTATEAEANELRLAAALKREADEAAARERAERDERELRALATARKERRDDR